MSCKHHWKHIYNMQVICDKCGELHDIWEFITGNLQGEVIAGEFVDRELEAVNKSHGIKPETNKLSNRINI